IAIGTPVAGSGWLGGIRLKSNSSGVPRITIDAPLNSTFATTEAISILDNGNVGVGTTTPISKLTVENSVGSLNGVRIVNSGSGIGDAAWLANSTTSGRVLALHKSGGTGDIMQAYYDGGGGYQIRLTLNNAGGLWIAGALTQNSD